MSKTAPLVKRMPIPPVPIPSISSPRRLILSVAPALIVIAVPPWAELIPEKPCPWMLIALLIVSPP